MISNITLGWFLYRSLNVVSSKAKFVSFTVKRAASARYTTFGVKYLLSKEQLFLSLQMQPYSLFGRLLILRWSYEIVKLIFSQQLFL